MLRCQILAGLHFTFGGKSALVNITTRSVRSRLFSVLYAIGIVELEFESTSSLILLLFVVPLAFTLSGFMLWILYSLNGKYIIIVRFPRY